MNPHLFRFLKAVYKILYADSLRKYARETDPVLRSLEEDKAVELERAFRVLSTDVGADGIHLVRERDT